MSARVHHLNCATMCPPLARALLNRAGKLVCHCLLIETEASGLVLVDTGLGLADLRDPRGRLGRGFLALARPRLDPAETAARQIEALGLRPSDVRHVVPTHLDLDHAGGLADFPDADVHIFAAEHDAALARATFVERERYRAAQWAHGPRWMRHDVAAGEKWMGFACVRALPGVAPDVLLVPAVGHTRGHCAVAVRAAAGGGWLLHCGDAYFHRAELDPRGRRCPLALEAFQRMAAMDGAARLRNQERLRALARDRAGEVRLFCAHDPSEWEALRGP